MTDKPEAYRHNGACGVGGDCPHPDHAPENDFPCCSQPAPSSSKSGSTDEPMLTASEVKVLTEAALRLGRQEAGEEIAVAIEAKRGAPDEHGRWSRAAFTAALTCAATIARDTSSQHQEVSEAVRSPQDRCGHPTCPCNADALGDPT